VRERVFAIVKAILDDQIKSSKRLIISEATQIKVQGDTILEVLEKMLKARGHEVDDNEQIIIKNIIANIEQVGDKYCQINFNFKVDKSG
jgi:hypothetical protein